MRRYDSGAFYLSRFTSAGDFDWTITWGGTPSYWDTGCQIGIDKLQNVFVAGSYRGTVDFDPGERVDLRTSNGGFDVFLVKYSEDGEYKWVRTFGGPLQDKCRGLAVDGDGDAHVAGSFEGTADFDPGDESQERTSAGGMDAFMCRFDTEGDLVWVRTWGGPGPDWATGMGIGWLGEILDTGSFAGSSDFDPGAGVDEHVSNGKDDVFVSKLDTTGDLDWVRCWGGPEDDRSYGVAVDWFGNAWLTGGFQGTVDFDPGDETDARTSNGDYDIFLTKLSSTGDYLWTKTWGGPGSDIGWENIADRDGNMYVIGWFEGTVDFDPGPEIAEKSSHGSKDIFLSMFDSDGGLVWVETIGGPGDDEGHAVLIDDDGDVYVTGTFERTVDFGTESQSEERTSQGKGVFIEKMRSSGELLWLRTWDVEAGE
jgi:hypothetical protein